MAYFPLATSFEARYRLVGPDGSVAVFNDSTDANYVGALTEVSGLDSAEIREAAADLTESDGGDHGAFYFGRRPVVLSGRVFNHATVAERNLRLDRARRASLALRGDSVLSWRPYTRRENWVMNPGVEVDTSNIIQGWSVTGGTRTRVTAQFQSGAAALQVVTTASVSQGASFSISGTLVAGVPVSVSFYVKGNAGGESLDYYVGQASGNFPYYGTTTSNTTGSITATTSWVRREFTFTPSSDMVSPQFTIRNATASAMTFFVDSVRVAPTAAFDTSYVDGDTAGFYWMGDRLASQSADYLEMFVSVRRQQPFRESGGWVKEFQIPLVSQYAAIFGTNLKNGVMGTSAENRGNYPAYPVISITGTSTNPTVSDGTRVFRTTGLTLASGETVAFDMLTHTGVFTAGARNGQIANRYIDFTNTAWPYLTGNGATQTFSLTGAGSATFQYRDTWA